MLVVAAAPILLSATGYFARLPQMLPGGATERPAVAAPVADLAAAVPEIALATQLMPISAEEAERLNELRGADRIDLVAAEPFAVKNQLRGDPRFLSALDCLTQAVYYEAGFEPDAGQRAVAQVVLNRVRHSAFPDNVCGVVYQGAELPTGCQFTFTCDGSLRRQPSPSAWARARRVALAALSGWVEVPAGLSTHYHATYVVPYWAAALDKVTLIGQHIFYAIRGRGGSAGAFHASYDFAGEFVPSSAMLPVQPLNPFDGAVTPYTGPLAPLPEENPPADGIVAGGTLDAGDAAPIASEQRVLEADRQSGALMVRGADSRLKVD